MPNEKPKPKIRAPRELNSKNTGVKGHNRTKTAAYAKREMGRNKKRMS